MEKNQHSISRTKLLHIKDLNISLTIFTRLSIKTCVELSSFLSNKYYCWFLCLLCKIITLNSDCVQLRWSKEIITKYHTDRLKKTKSNDSNSSEMIISKNLAYAIHMKSVRMNERAAGYRKTCVRHRLVYARRFKWIKTRPVSFVYNLFFAFSSLVDFFWVGFLIMYVSSPDSLFLRICQFFRTEIEWQLFDITFTNRQFQKMKCSLDVREFDIYWRFFNVIPENLINFQLQYIWFNWPITLAHSPKKCS